MTRALYVGEIVLKIRLVFGCGGHERMGQVCLDGIRMPDGFHFLNPQCNTIRPT